ncbi:MAG: redox-regulated ATPase YchF [Acidiferrobacterales bacterium]|nr:redox-regulated ATPase YchF [Acidiferrobacterales bacterium]
MTLKCGIIGLPNAGKSTLFNALTRMGVPAESYPFCTIEPNVGIVAVPDPRLQRVAEIAKPARVVPNTMEFVDIAGLVAGASKGEGLGNQFLAHIREVDAIAHVVRCFERENVPHVSGSVDPSSDIETVRTELALADLETISRALERAQKASKAGDKEAVELCSLLERVGERLNRNESLHAMDLDAASTAALRPYNLLTAKAVLYIANVDESAFDDNPCIDTVRRVAQAEGAETVPVCATFETELAAMDAEEQQPFLVDLGLEEPGLNRIVRAAYRLLGLRTFFSTQSMEVRAWTLPAGATAVEAAGAIHSDFARGFIRAEVVGYQDYVRLGGEHGAREAGKLRLEGRDYVVNDGDVIHFRFNV